MGETILELQNIAKHFGDTDVLNGISISIGKGEFITLLGPSGCGKTTTLRIIAGLETPDEGRVILNGQDVTDSEPNKRDVNTVFQNYALFPHMTVAANIGYSLKLKKRPKDEIKSRGRRAGPLCSSPATASACLRSFPAGSVSVSPLPAPW